MTKLKVLFWLLLIAVLVTFALENAVPGPQLKLLRHELGNPPVFITIYGAFIVGFLVGWLTHFLQTKKRKRAQEAPSAREEAESPQAPQEEQQQ